MSFGCNMLCPTMRTFSSRRVAVAAIFTVELLLLIAFYTTGPHHERHSLGSIQPVISEGSRVRFAPHRKLLNHHAAAVEPNRIWGEKCSKSDIVITQGPTTPMPDGIPTYTVEIMNVCVTGCDISGIHLSCGWFSSARLINPRIFKRLNFDDCLVNNGKPLVNGFTVSFQYANTFSYPLSVSSVVC